MSRIGIFRRELRVEPILRVVRRIGNFEAEATKAARGYDRPLPYTEKELRTIVELLREMQMKRSPDY